MKPMTLQLQNQQETIICNQGCWELLSKTLQTLVYSKIIVICDENTYKKCLPFFLQQSKIEHPSIITIPVGEKYKTIETCLFVWNKLSHLKADKKSVILNLGGGVVTDLGGFVASTYQRGIPFINIPTSLLAMVDASVGGKNGVDLGSLKNQIGVINSPNAVIVATAFLQTLPLQHLRSGMAEMLKHGLLTSKDYLNRVFDFEIATKKNAETLIWESICIKNEVVRKDPLEKAARKTLNYGHTLGHAIESFFLEHPTERALLHGEAIVIGMILESYISHRLLGFPIEIVMLLIKKCAPIFPTVHFDEKAIEAIIKLLIHDKKNTHGKVQFVLLENIGVYKTDCTVDNQLIFEAFNFYKKNTTL